MMRIPACLLVLCVAGPALGQEKLSFDFRGARFHSDSFRYGGPTPDKYMKVEAEGLHVRYTGADAPPTNNPSGVSSRYHVRGNFVVTTRYEILRCEPPTKGTFYTGAELYVQLNNANSDAVTLARGVYPNGSAAVAFKLLTKDATGKRDTKDFKRLNTTERSLRGRLRLARAGPIITGYFAEGDDPEFTEVQRSESGTADIRLIRLVGTAGGDARAVLDMRILDFQLEGEALSLDGPFAAPPPPKPDISRPRTDPPHATSGDLARPAGDPTPASKQNPLLLAVIFSAFVLATLVVVAIVFLSRRRKAAIGVATRPRERKGAGTEGR